MTDDQSAENVLKSIHDAQAAAGGRVFPVQLEL